MQTVELIRDFGVSVFMLVWFVVRVDTHMRKTARALTLLADKAQIKVEED